jgi:3-oxoacyl-[acyl-carrier-protein] synthase-3
MIWRDLYIAATASFLPPRTDIAAIISQGSRPFQAALGYRSATIAAPRTGLQMATRAALRALATSGHTAQELSLLTLAAVMPDTEETFPMPACHVQRILGADKARAVELGAGSAGDLAGLLAAAEHLTADPTAQAAMAVAASCMTGTDRQVSPDQIVTDGAAALVLTRRPGRARLVATSHAAAPELEVITHMNLTTSERKTVIDNLAKPFLNTMRDKTREAVGLVLDEAHSSVEKLARVVLPGAGIPFLTTVITLPLGLDLADTTWPFSRHLGHVGPCDHLLGLDHLLQTDPNLKPGDQILIVGMGVGWRWICALIEIAETSP